MVDGHMEHDVDWGGLIFFWSISVMLMFVVYTIIANEACKANTVYCNDKLLCDHHEIECEAVYPERYDMTGGN